MEVDLTGLLILIYGAMSDIRGTPMCMAVCAWTSRLVP